MMEQQKEPMSQQNFPNDEITIKELILKIKEFSREVLKNWKLAVLVSGLFGIFFLLRAYFTPITYTAKLTFMVNEDEGGAGGISNILGQFGFGGSKSEYNIAKILSLSSSRRIIGNALFEKAIVEGEKDYLANHLIRVYKLHDNWEESESGLKGFLFKNEKIDSFNLAENRALKTVVSQVKGNSKQNILGLFSTSFNSETAIMDFVVKSKSEQLSLELIKSLYEKLSEFYIEKSIERQKHTLNLIKQKKDSIEAVLSRTQFRVLKFEDTYRNLTLKQNNAQKLQIERELQVASIAYGKIVENYELADFSLKNATPFFQPIDAPIPPLSSSYSITILLMQLITGVILGLILASVFLIGKKIYYDAMD